MRARQWTIAAAFSEPAEYGVPELPDWEVRREDCGALVIAADDQAYIAAEQPMRVRR